MFAEEMLVFFFWGGGLHVVPRFRQLWCLAFFFLSWVPVCQRSFVRLEYILH